MTAAPRRTMSWPCSVIRTRTPSWNCGERPCAEGLDGRFREWSVEKFRGAGEHDLREVEHADDGRERDAEALSRVPEDSFAGSSSDAAPSRAVSAGTDEPGLEASDLAADAQRAAVGADGDVADLARGEAAAAHGLAAREQARADTAADLDEQHVVAGSAERVLGEHRGVGVVRDEHRQAERALQRALEVEARPAEVRGGEDDAVVVDDTGRADADAEHGRVGVGDELASEFDDRRDDIVRAPGAATSRRATMSPSSVSTAPMNESLPDRSMPTMRCPSRSRSTRIAGLPGPDASRTPFSTTKPSAMSSATRSEIVTRVSPVSRERSARLIAPWWKRVCSTSERLWPRACSGSTFVPWRSERPGPNE